MLCQSGYLPLKFSMRSLHHLFLAQASLSTIVLTEDVAFTYSHWLDHAESENAGGLEVDGRWFLGSQRAESLAKKAAARYPPPRPQCGTWVGIEMIFEAEITHVCPNGSTGRPPPNLFFRKSLTNRASSD